MALQTMTLDPDAVPLTPDEVVAKVNAASDNIERAGSVTATARPIGAGEVTAAKLAASAARDNLDGMAHVDRKYVRTNPTVGQYKIVHFQRSAIGLLEVEYDDTPVE